MRPLATILSALLMTVSAASAESTGQPSLSFPAELRTIDGGTLDLRAVARTSTVVVVTLKAHWCPVCRNQLRRIKENQQALADCGVTFVILAPGPRDELATIQRETGLAYPFVEDVNLDIARSLGLQLSANEIAPAILMLNRDLKVGWVQQGRSANYYGDCELMKEIACWEKIAI
jgi:peroxiredoxin